MGGQEWSPSWLGKNLSAAWRRGGWHQLVGSLPVRATEKADPLEDRLDGRSWLRWHLGPPNTFGGRSLHMTAVPASKTASTTPSPGGQTTWAPWCGEGSNRLPEGASGRGFLRAPGARGGGERGGGAAEDEAPERQPRRIWPESCKYIIANSWPNLAKQWRKPCKTRPTSPNVRLSRVRRTSAISWLPSHMALFRHFPEGNDYP